MPARRASSARSGGTAQPAARMPIANGAFLTQIRSQGMNGHNNREGGKRMLKTTIAGSLPKPAWLAEPRKLWPAWRPAGEELGQAKRDATLLWLKAQEDAGLDIVTDGELKITMPGPMTIVDTIADEHYGDKVKLAMAFAALLNQEARALEKDGVDVIQFDEPAFNVYMADVKRWGIQALHRAIQGLKCTTCVHICYGYGIQANLDWKKTLGEEWRQYEEIFPALAKSKIDQVSLECIHSHVPVELLRLLKGKDVLIGVIDVASDNVETPAEVAAVIAKAAQCVPHKRLYPCTNCGMAPMDREVALKKLQALVAGTQLARRKLK